MKKLVSFSFENDAQFVSIKSVRSHIPVKEVEQTEL